MSTATDTPAELTPAELEALTPEQIDELLFPLWADRWLSAKYLHDYRKAIALTIWPEAAGYRHGVRERGCGTHSLRQYAEGVAKFEAKLADNAARRAPLESEFERRGGWTRYILVKGGHLHYNGCSTLRFTTECLLIPAASGLDQSEVVGKFGETACTKCFPDAPVAGKKALPAGTCEGSGTYEVDDVRGSLRLYRPYGRCRKCGHTASVTSTGKLRQHKIEAGK